MRSRNRKGEGSFSNAPINMQHLKQNLFKLQNKIFPRKLSLLEWENYQQEENFGGHYSVTDFAHGEAYLRANGEPRNKEVL